MSETTTFLETAKHERAGLLTSELEAHRLGAQVVYFAVSYIVNATA